MPSMWHSLMRHGDRPATPSENEAPWNTTPTDRKTDLMHTTTLYINETISKMSAPVADPVPASFHLDDAPSPVASTEDDAAAWAEFRASMFPDLPPAPVVGSTNLGASNDAPEAAEWAAFRATLTDPANR